MEFSKLHHCCIMKILILFASIALTCGLVATFGWISIAVCFALALGSLVFSSGQIEDDAQQASRQDDERYLEASAAQGGL
jgi:hypothetical protein